jgi:hypothetical protein
VSVQEINLLHRRYVDLSDRFRAAWAFHKFVGSLHKILLGDERPEFPVDFQEVYGELKEVSSQLNAASAEMVRDKLDHVDRQLARLIWALLEEDSRIEPSSLRLLFNRVKSIDVKILTQLVKFYLYSSEGAGWPPDRIDKLDFLLTRVAAESPPSAGVAADREATSGLLKGIWQLTGSVAPAAETVADRCRAIAELRAEMAAVGDLDELEDRRVVSRYRDLKHSLGALFFHPEVMAAILETNLKLREQVQELYHQVERKLFADYQHVFDLERGLPAGSGLEEELGEFHREVADFEQALGQEDLSLDKLARIRERMRSLLPRMAPPDEETTATATGGEEGGAAGGAPPRAAALAEGSVGDGEELVSEQYRRLIEALEGSDPAEAPRAVSHRPEIFPFRLEAREVVAYRRRQAGGEVPEMERFLLEAAALRVVLNEQLEEIRSILDDSATTGEAPILPVARRSTRLADRYLRRFAHYLDQAVLAGEAQEAKDLQLLRMRLMRDYAGLWLLANKPLR